MGLFDFKEESEYTQNSYATQSVDNGTPDVKISVPGGLNETPSAKPYDLKSIPVPGGDGETPNAKPYDQKSVPASGKKYLTDEEQKKAIAMLQKSFKEVYEMTEIIAGHLKPDGNSENGGNNMYSENLFGFFGDNDESYTESVYSNVKKAFSDKLDKDLKGSVADDGERFMSKKSFDALKAKIQPDLDAGYKDYVANCGNYKAKKQPEWEAANIIERIKKGTFGSSNDGDNAVAANKQQRKADREANKENRAAEKLSKQRNKEYQASYKKRVAAEANDRCEKEAEKAFNAIPGHENMNYNKFLRDYKKANLPSCMDKVSKVLMKESADFDLSADEYLEMRDSIYEAYLFESSIYENVMASGDDDED